MIKGLYETHLNVGDLERSIHFYGSVLGLTQCYFERERRAAFFWIGKPREHMLGLWEKPKDQIHTSHFAFACEPDWVINDSVAFLQERNLPCRNFLNDGAERPMVFAWMPAVSIYFDDPDGHSLEFIGVLPGDSRPEKGIITYDAWVDLQPAK